MAIAGTLTVNVLARTQGFGKNIGRARKDLRGFKKEAMGTSAVMKRLQGALAGILGGLTVRAGFNFLRNQVEVAAALKNTAQTLDLTTEELGLFQFAAKTAGVESRQLNISIQRMSRRIGEAALGGGELSKTLIRLGLDAKALSKLSVGDQFLAMGDALSKITNQDEQLAAIFKTFDSEGVPVFRVFGDNLDRARQLYERFNLALNSTDAAKLDELATQASILKEAFGVSGRNFLVDISPEVLKAIATLQDLLAQRKPGEARIGDTALQAAARRRRELPVELGGQGIKGGRTFFERVLENTGLPEISRRAGRFEGANEGGRNLNSRQLEARRQNLIGGRSEFSESQPAELPIPFFRRNLMPGVQPFQAMEDWLEKIARNTEQAGFQ